LPTKRRFTSLSFLLYRLCGWLPQEADILKGLDTDRVTIDIIAFHDERAHADAAHISESDAKAAVLEKKGYDCSRHARENRWCKRKGFVDVRTREKKEKAAKKADPQLPWGR
jgi:hypothetical protein